MTDILELRRFFLQKNLRNSDVLTKFLLWYYFKVEQVNPVSELLLL